MKSERFAAGRAANRQKQNSSQKLTIETIQTNRPFKLPFKLFFLVYQLDRLIQQNVWLDQFAYSPKAISQRCRRVPLQKVLLVKLFVCVKSCEISAKAKSEFLGE